LKKFHCRTSTRSFSYAGYGVADGIVRTSQLATL
jgi:hypothetical protein